MDDLVFITNRMIRPNRVQSMKKIGGHSAGEDEYQKRYFNSTFSDYNRTAGIAQSG